MRVLSDKVCFGRPVGREKEAQPGTQEKGSQGFIRLSCCLLSLEFSIIKG